jgi:hypothetical protein
LNNYKKSGQPWIGDLDATAQQAFAAVGGRAIMSRGG